MCWRLFITNIAFIYIIITNVEVVVAKAKVLTLFLNIYLYNVFFYSKYNTSFVLCLWFFVLFCKFSDIKNSSWHYSSRFNCQYKKLVLVIIFSFYYSCRKDDQFNCFQTCLIDVTGFFIFFFVEFSAFCSLQFYRQWTSIF